MKYQYGFGMISSDIATGIKELSDVDFYDVFSELGNIYGFDMQGDNDIEEFCDWLKQALTEIKHK